MTKNKKQLNIETLKRQIDKGKSLSDVSVSMGKSKSTILKAANDNGLEFKNKSSWINL